MRKQKGFTFIELLAVIVILGILITLATIAVSSLKKKQDEKNYLNEVSAIFSGAKAYIADHPERLSFGATAGNVYKCSGIYSVYGTRRGDSSFSIINGASDKIDLYLYLNEELYKLDGTKFKKFNYDNKDVVYTWEKIGMNYDESEYYNIFLGWYDFSQKAYTSWDKNWTAEGIESEDVELDDNGALFKAIIDDNNKKVVCATSENDISISARRLDELGYISIEKNSQLYNYLYNTYKFFTKGNLAARVSAYLEGENPIPGEGGPLMDSHRIGLYRCVNLNTSEIDYSENKSLNVVYEFYKFKLNKNEDSNKLYEDYIPVLESIYNDCGCEEQENGSSPKLCSAKNFGGGYCTYWSGGNAFGNWALNPLFGCNKDN